MCKKCSGMGHKTEDCRNKVTVKQEWVPKKIEKKEKEVDQEGFQVVTKGKKALNEKPIQ